MSQYDYLMAIGYLQGVFSWFIDPVGLHKKYQQNLEFKFCETGEFAQNSTSKSYQMTS